MVKRSTFAGGLILLTVLFIIFIYATYALINPDYPITVLYAIPLFGIFGFAWSYVLDRVVLYQHPITQEEYLAVIDEN